MRCIGMLTVGSGVLAVALSAPARGADPAFSEIAIDLGMGAPHATSGFTHWTYTGGGAAGDFNNDGFQDLFVPSGGVGDRPDHLYINDGKGNFSDDAAAWGLTDVHLGKGVSVGDFNDDGWLDIYVTSAGPVGNATGGRHRLYRNNGGVSFTDVAVAAGVNQTSVSQDGFGSCFGDFDLDGDLDLFVAGFASGNSGSKLFRNNLDPLDGVGPPGDPDFTDITDDIGFFDNTGSMSAFAPRFIDTDGDFYPEMLLVADFGTSHYFRNNANGTFTDVTTAAGLGLDENGMGQTVGDFNNDGLIDWYVTSIYLPQTGWTGNKLYFNLGGHSFDEQADTLGCDDGGYGWGALGIDFNHDGLTDIAETNGDGSDGSIFADEQSYLWIQNGNGSFTEMALQTGFVHTGKGRGMVNLDFDNDGDQDVVILANNERLHFFRNDLSGPDTNWLRVFLDTTGVPGLAPHGLGTRVWVTAGGDTQLRIMTTGDNFQSHGESSAHFGLGAATVIETLLVEWPDGTSKTLTDIPANQTMTLDPFAIGDLDHSGIVDTVDFLSLLADWGPCPAPCPPSSPGCPADLNFDCSVDTVDFLLLLSNWGG